MRIVHRADQVKVGDLVIGTDGRELRVTEVKDGAIYTEPAPTHKSIEMQWPTEPCDCERCVAARKQMWDGETLRGGQ